MLTKHKNTFFMLKLFHMGITVVIFYAFWMLFRYGSFNIFSSISSGFSSLINGFSNGFSGISSAFSNISSWITGSAGSTGSAGVASSAGSMGNGMSGGSGGVVGIVRSMGAMSGLEAMSGGSSGGGSFEHRYDYFITIGYALLLYLFNRTYNSYLLGFTRIRGLAFAQFMSQIFSSLIIYLAVSIAWVQMKSPLYFLSMLGTQLILDCIWSISVSTLYFKVNPPRRTIFIYRDELDKIRFGSIAGKPVGRIYRIEKEFQYRGLSFKEIRSELEGFEAVFVAGVSSRCRNGILKYCVEKQIPGFFLPHVGDVLMRGALHIQTFTSPVMYFSRKEVKPEYLMLKRAFDFSSSLLGLIVLSPLMLIVAVCIKLSDGGPVLYRQTRLTEGGREFEILKFRSMRVDAEKDGIARLSTGDDDDRITAVGKIMRKYRFDEFPQLINVLKGDMSIVGPRPERPEIAKEYYETIPDFRLRLQIRAGLTGYAQVYGKYNTNPYEKLEFDLLYINDMSFLTDLKLIFATFSILGNKESVEGIAKNNFTEHQK